MSVGTERLCPLLPEVRALVCGEQTAVTLPLSPAVREFAGHYFCLMQQHLVRRLGLTVAQPLYNGVKRVPFVGLGVVADEHALRVRIDGVGVYVHDCQRPDEFGMLGGEYEGVARACGVSNEDEVVQSKVSHE